MKRWVIISVVAVALLVLLAAVITAIQTGVDNSKFVVGKPLPAGRVTPQLAVDYMGRAAMLAPDGSLWGWGGNPTSPGLTFAAVPMARGTNLVASPVRIGDDMSWRKMSLWQGGVVALKSDGSLWTWDNSLGRPIGSTGASTKPVSPTRIGSDSDWVEISGNVSHFMALKADGSLWGWGQNESGQIGDGTTNGSFRSTTPLMVGTDHDWKAISAGSFNSYALKQDGTLWGWGSSINSGASNQTNVASPEQIDPGTNWVAISAGDYHLLALKSDGTIWVRGQNVTITAPAAFSQSSYSRLDKRILVQVGTDSDWDRIVSGQNCFFVRKKDGSWWACGSDGDWQLGLGLPTNPNVAVGRGGRGAGPGTAFALARGQNVASLQRLPFDSDPWAFTSGGPSTLMLTKDGSLWSFGTRLGVSKSALDAKSPKGWYNAAKAWFQKTFRPHSQTAVQTAVAVGGRGRRGGGPLGGVSADVVTDYLPYRIWNLPPEVRAALEKAASSDGKK